MDVEPWQIMIGLSILLVLFGAIAYLFGSEPEDILTSAILVGGIILAMYVGWRIGNLFGNRRGN